METTSVSDNNVMSTDEIKELISQGTAGKDFDSEDSSETNGTSISKTSKKTKKTRRKTRNLSFQKYIMIIVLR